MYFGIILTPNRVLIKEIIEEKDILIQKELILKIKNKVYKNLWNFENMTRYPTEAITGFKEANINDLVAFTLYLILACFKHEVAK